MTDFNEILFRKLYKQNIINYYKDVKNERVIKINVR